MNGETFLKVKVHHMHISATTKICMIIGDPVKHSLSPALHNAAYEAIGIDDQFVFVAAHVKAKNLKEVVCAVRMLEIRGLTCTIPHKTEVIKYLDDVDEIAKKIRAVNTVVNEDGILKGYNTDWLGVVTPLTRLTSIKGKKVALIGAGGAARAISYGMIQKGAALTIYNRTKKAAEELAKETGGQAASFEDLANVQSADIIINATPLGMSPHHHETPIKKEYITSNHIVFDAVYNPYETRLLQEAKEKKAKIIHGIEMLLYQGTAQFELYTGKKAPEKVMREALLQHFQES